MPNSPSGADGTTPTGAETDPFERWRRLRQARGPRVTVIDLYGLAAQPRGLKPHDLPLAERIELSKRALAMMYDGFELTADSDRGREPIELVPYDERWPATFDHWRTRLADALWDTAVRIEHVGSTSVPGLPAKPVIDIQVSVADVSDEERYVPHLAELGLQLRSRDVEHRYFRPFPGARRDVHVHVCRAGSGWERDHLLFRDYLRAMPDARQAYEESKAEAAATWRDDRMAYTEAKSSVILDTMARANIWAETVGWTATSPPPGRQPSAGR